MVKKRKTKRFGLSTQKTSTIKALLRSNLKPRTAIGRANKALFERELKIRRRKR